MRGTDCRAAAGPDALIEAATGDADLVMAAIVGCAGLAPTMAAVEAGKTVALANKEALVTAGDLMTDAAAKSGATLLPVDSEHNAIFQSLAGSRIDQVSRIILTASGGPFRTASADAYARCDTRAGRGSPQLEHGREDLGRFGDSDEQGPRADRGALSLRVAVGADRHPDPSAIGHPFAGRICGRVGARAAGVARHANSRSPMPWRGRTGWRRPPSGWTSRPSRASISRSRIWNASRRFALPARRWRQGGSAPAVLNAANEIAVASFLEGRIQFPDISRLVETRASGK